MYYKVFINNNNRGNLDIEQGIKYLKYFKQKLIDDEQSIC